MLPIGKALAGNLAHTGVIGASILSAVERSPASSVLPDIESSGVFVTGIFQPPARGTVLRPADFPSGCPVGIFPRKTALLPSATAAFTCPPEPCDFAVLCQLVDACPALYAVSVRQPAGFR
jgi:hypothetical protein